MSGGVASERQSHGPHWGQDLSDKHNPTYFCFLSYSKLTNKVFGSNLLPQAVGVGAPRQMSRHTRHKIQDCQVNVVAVPSKPGGGCGGPKFQIITSLDFFGNFSVEK
jgi:hypothetical protein